MNSTRGVEVEYLPLRILRIARDFIVALKNTSRMLGLNERVKKRVKIGSPYQTGEYRI